MREPCRPGREPSKLFASAPLASLIHEKGSPSVESFVYNFFDHYQQAANSLPTAGGCIQNLSARRNAPSNFFVSFRHPRSPPRPTICLYRFPRSPSPLFPIFLSFSISFSRLYFSPFLSFEFIRSLSSHHWRSTTLKGHSGSKDRKCFNKKKYMEIGVYIYIRDRVVHSILLDGMRRESRSMAGQSSLAATSMCLIYIGNIPN